MKGKIANILNFTCKALTIIILAGLVSCSKWTTGDETEFPLSFVASANGIVEANLKNSGTGNTRALVENVTDLQNYPISILAKATKETSTYPIFSNEKLYYTQNEKIWKYDNTQYWIPEADYYFSAFAPYAGASGSTVTNCLSNGTVSVTGEDSSPAIKITGYNTGKGSNFDARTEDLLFATTTRYNSYTSNTVDYSPVLLDFSHKLACVSFYIRNTTNSDITSITDISLRGIQYKCNIDVNTTSVNITPDSDTTNNNTTNYFKSDNRTSSEGAFLPKGMSEIEYKPLFDCEYLTVLPQPLWGNDIIKLQFKEGEGGTNNIRTLKLGKIESVRRWEEGKKYRYNISITSTDIIFQVVEVPWIEHEVEL